LIGRFSDDEQLYFAADFVDLHRAEAMQAKIAPGKKAGRCPAVISNLRYASTCTPVLVTQQ
jgi:hypothetical protein